MTAFPLRYARRNVLIGPGGEAAALYRADTIAYPFLPTAREVGAAAAAGALRPPRRRRLLDLAGPARLSGRALRARARRPRRRAPRRPRGLAALPGGPRGAAARAPLPRPGGLRRRLPGGGSGGPSALRSFGRLRRRVEELAGVGGPRPISGAELEALAAAEQRTFDRLSGAIALAAGIDRASCNGCFAARPVAASPSPSSRTALGARRAGRRRARRLESPTSRWSTISGAARTRRPARTPASRPSLEVEAEEGTSYQAFLCAGSLAEEAEFPGAAELLFAPAEDAGFPVDAVLHAQWVGNREALGQVRKRILDVEHAYREQFEGASGPGVLAEEDRELAREYEAILQSSAHPPMLRASISLAVGAPDREELERRVTALRERFGDVSLHRPRGLQHALFADHLPAARTAARCPTTSSR